MTVQPHKLTIAASPLTAMLCLLLPICGNVQQSLARHVATGRSNAMLLNQGYPVARRSRRQASQDIGEAGLTGLVRSLEGTESQLEFGARRNGSLPSDPSILSNLSNPSTSPAKLDQAYAYNPSPPGIPSSGTATVKESQLRDLYPFTSPVFTDHDPSVRSTAIEVVLNDKPWSGAVPFFVGDAQGIGYVLDILEPERANPTPAQHFLIPQSLPSLLDPDDINYLRAKGVFSLPPSEVCDELLRCYFHHIHPILPILEADRLLNAYVDGGVQKLNLLLIWSIFSVAVNYTRDEVCQRAGFQTRRDMKRAAFSRAKCMYDNGREQDKVVLVQSTLLMSFWYSDTEDRTESWHWIGIAISLAQTMGFHRNPDSHQRNSRLSERQRHLWRRLWWCCLYRDRWQSFGMGRPMRIVIEDCDTASPSTNDVLVEAEGLSAAARKFIPHDLALLTKYWMILLELTATLGIILAGQWRRHTPLIDTTSANTLDKQLSTAMGSLSSGLMTPQSSFASFYENLLQLHHSAAIVALLRPYDREGEQPWGAFGKSATQKIREAASKINLTLDAIFIAGLTNYIGPMAIPLIVPAMHTHLLDLRSPENLVRQMASNKLAFCMTVMDELKALYPAASFIHDLFGRAKLNLETQQSPSELHAQRIRIPFGARMSTEFETPQSTSVTTAGELPLLFNDSTLFDFWDPNSIFPYSFSAATDVHADVNRAVGYNEFEDTFSSMWASGQM
ncbi:hypothetical protein BU16DRAFT_566176 [Lophium mytilinum]|uniref:Xylanolytic transcriptional activator regulatory domain-containing protein n=1 Tax=Lophium mytilinum TaxID=390894 RepID=A0A6A6QGU1_9PEZI|nr:hypothetical protein BU16DRAFT_566176 [Lophium mytilinum]